MNTKKNIFYLIIALGMLCISAYSQTTQLPKIIIDGFEVYKKDGAPKAFDSWLAGSALEKDITTKSSIAGGIAQIEAGFGKYVGYEYIGTVVFTPSIRRYYLAILYEKGPSYTWFEVYTHEGKDVISSFDCNTKANLILPATFIEKK
jgi:hypothetical protein